MRRTWFAGRFRVKVVGALAVLLALAAGLLWWAVGIPQYDQNLALNVGADLIGASVTIFVVSPLITRAQHGRVREHRRLDYDWFTTRVMRSAAEVRILDTFSNLFDRPGTVRFFQAVRAAIARQVHVRVLLLHPDSLAAAQRASELAGGRSHADLRTAIVRNIRVLSQFASGLDPQHAHRFNVRLYSVSASVTLYRCDDQVLVSFLPVGRLSGDGTQLEITSASPLGTFVGERFEELWDYGVPVSSFMRMQVEIFGADPDPQTFVCDFVRHDDLVHLADPDVHAHVASVDASRLYAVVAGEIHRLQLVGQSDQETLVSLYRQKYESVVESFIRLIPE